MCPLSLIAQGASLPNTKDLNKSFESEIKNLAGEEVDVKFPSLSGANFGELENNEESLYLESVDYKYSKKVPKDMVAFINDKTKQIVGKKVKLKDFIIFLKQLEQGFVEIGYPMVRVVFPAQSLEAKKSTPMIYIISGIVEAIIIKDDKKEEHKDVQQVILNILNPLKNKEYIDVKTINEKMHILKGVYGLSSKIFLSRGKKQGGFVVNVKVLYKDRQRVAIVKNNLDSIYGSYSLQMMQVNNFVKNGVAQKVRIIPSISLKQTNDVYYRSLTLGYSRYFPTGSSMEMSVSESRSASVTDNNYKIYSENTNVSVMYRQPRILNYLEQFYISTGFQYTNSTMKNKNTNSYQYKDVTVDAIVGGDYTLKTTQGTHKVTFSLNKAMNVLGSKYTKINSVPASRDGVKGTASRIIGSYAFSKNLPSREEINVVFHFQHTFNQPVLSDQQYSGTGFEKVQGLIGKGLSGDEGYSIYAEYNLKPQMIEGNLFTPFLSTAFTELGRNNLTVLESKNGIAKSISAGFSTSFNSNMLLRASLNYAEKHDGQSVYDKSIGFNLVQQF